LVIGNTIMEMPLYAPFRRKERFAIRRTIGERISKSNARVVSAPEPLSFPKIISARSDDAIRTELAWQ
jgi:hypothetical protein